jgi:predicted GH43/DUF377 family glycosyl hydrolase
MSQLNWTKLGRVYVPTGEFGWNKIGAFLPTTLLMDDIIRVYISMHDENMVGRIGYVDVDANNPLKILKISKTPVLDIGEPGMFDDNGVTPASIIEYDDVLYLYYVGWQLGVKVRYYLFPGVAISENGGNTFRRLFKSPILDRCPGQEFLRTAPSVIVDNDKFFMWYVAGGKWILLNGKTVPTYRMYHIRSDSPYLWPKSPGITCLYEENENEFGYGRPQVIKENDFYKMFYSIRYKDVGYRLGYAESSDALCFERKDNLMNIDVSDVGWDSESLSFASIVDYNNKRYMFYNGSHGGRTGFGVALLEDNK